MLNLNTAFVMGLKLKSEHLKLQIKAKGLSAIEAEWKLGKWNVPKQPAINKRSSEQAATICYNCGMNHELSECTFPLYSVPCTHCLVVSVNGTNHTSSCMPTNKISAIRSNLLAEKAITLFKMGYDPNDVQTFYLHNEIFVEITPTTKLLSAPTESILSVQAASDKEQCIVMQQTSFKRCGILFAIMDKKGIWRIRFRGVVTPKHGLIIFKVSQTMSIVNGKVSVPNDFGNTIAIIGIKTQPTIENFYLKFQVHANSSGFIGKKRFNGYTGFIAIDLLKYGEVEDVDKELLQPRRVKKFQIDLYKPEPTPLSTSASQKMAPAIVK